MTEDGTIYFKKDKDFEASLPTDSEAGGARFRKDLKNKCSVAKYTDGDRTPPSLHVSRTLKKRKNELDFSASSSPVV